MRRWLPLGQLVLVIVNMALMFYWAHVAFCYQLEVFELKKDAKLLNGELRRLYDELRREKAETKCWQEGFWDLLRLKGKQPGEPLWAKPNGRVA